ncbi:MAG: hypothetical protein ACFFB3_23965, partial [Candidatus Hodarchaeota archaeon]
LYLRELVAVAVRSLANVPYRDILNQIIRLSNIGMLASVEEEGKVSKIDLAIEAIDRVLAQEEQESAIDESASVSGEKAGIADEFAVKEIIELSSDASISSSELSSQLEEEKDIPVLAALPDQAIDLEKTINQVLEILTNQKPPDLPMNLIVDILKREIIYSEGMGTILGVETSEIELSQAETLVKGQIKGKISRNALEGPLFDTKFRNLTLRVSISKINEESAVFIESVVP